MGALGVGAWWGRLVGALTDRHMRRATAIATRYVLGEPLVVTMAHDQERECWQIIRSRLTIREETSGPWGGCGGPRPAGLRRLRGAVARETDQRLQPRLRRGYSRFDDARPGRRQIGSGGFSGGEELLVKKKDSVTATTATTGLEPRLLSFEPL